jgi:hypothetical protein
VLPGKATLTQFSGLVTSGADVPRKLPIKQQASAKAALHEIYIAKSN